MILTGPEIVRQRETGHLWIDPFNPTFVTTNTYDLTLGESFCEYECDVVDPARPNPYRIFTAPTDGVHLDRGQFLLGHSVERIGSEHFVPIIHARSSIARLGLFVHVTADLIDIGSCGQVTFQLYATMPIILVPGHRIAQVSFWVPKGKIVLYSGKYQGSSGPRPSEAHREFEKVSP